MSWPTYHTQTIPLCMTGWPGPRTSSHMSLTYLLGCENLLALQNEDLHCIRSATVLRPHEARGFSLSHDCTDLSHGGRTPQAEGESVSGQVVAIMGPSGAGKSTLLYALMGTARYGVTRGAAVRERPGDAPGALAQDPGLCAAGVLPSAILRRSGLLGLLSPRDNCLCTQAMLAERLFCAVPLSHTADLTTCQAIQHLWQSCGETSERGHAARMGVCGRMT